MLTEEEKKQIQERVAYEEKLRQQYRDEERKKEIEKEKQIQAVQSLKQKENDKTEFVRNQSAKNEDTNPYSYIYSYDEIQTKVIPYLHRLVKYVDTLEEKLGHYDELVKTKKSKEEDRGIVYAIPIFSIIIGIFVLILWDLAPGWIEVSDWVAEKYFIFKPLDTIYNSIDGVLEALGIFGGIISLIVYLTLPTIVTAIVNLIPNLLYNGVIKRYFLNKQIAELDKEIEVVSNDCFSYHNENKVEMSVIPEKYRIAPVIKQILSYFEDHRAMSFKDAFNLLEEERKFDEIKEALGEMMMHISQLEEQVSKMHRITIVHEYEHHFR